MNPVHNILGFKARMNFREIHHGYIGIAMVVSTYWLTMYPGWSTFMAIAGLILFTDDAYQHHHQVRCPEYHSPIHQFYGKYLYPIPFIQKLNRIADWLFGKT